MSAPKIPQKAVYNGEPSSRVTIASSNMSPSAPDFHPGGFVPNHSNIFMSGFVPHAGRVGNRPMYSAGMSSPSGTIVEQVNQFKTTENRSSLDPNAPEFVPGTTKGAVVVTQPRAISFSPMNVGPRMHTAPVLGYIRPSHPTPIFVGGGGFVPGTASPLPTGGLSINQPSPTIPVDQSTHIASTTPFSMQQPPVHPVTISSAAVLQPISSQQSIAAVSPGIPTAAVILSTEEKQPETPSLNKAIQISESPVATIERVIQSPVDQPRTWATIAKQSPQSTVELPVPKVAVDVTSTRSQPEEEPVAAQPSPPAPRVRTREHGKHREGISHKQAGPQGGRSRNKKGISPRKDKSQETKEQADSPVVVAANQQRPKPAALSTPKNEPVQTPSRIMPAPSGVVEPSHSRPPVVAKSTWATIVTGQQQVTVDTVSPSKPTIERVTPVPPVTRSKPKMEPEPRSPEFQSPESRSPERSAEDMISESSLDMQRLEKSDVVVPTSSELKVEESELKVEESELKVEDSGLKVDESELKVEESELKVDDDKPEVKVVDESERIAAQNLELPSMALQPLEEEVLAKEVGLNKLDKSKKLSVNALLSLPTKVPESSRPSTAKKLIGSVTGSPPGRRFVEYADKLFDGVTPDISGEDRWYKQPGPLGPTTTIRSKEGINSLINRYQLNEYPKSLETYEQAMSKETLSKLDTELSATTRKALPIQIQTESSVAINLKTLQAETNPKGKIVYNIQDMLGVKAHPMCVSLPTDIIHPGFLSILSTQDNLQRGGFALSGKSLDIEGMYRSQSMTTRSSSDRFAVPASLRPGGASLNVALDATEHIWGQKSGRRTGANIPRISSSYGASDWNRQPARIVPVPSNIPLPSLTEDSWQVKQEQQKHQGDRTVNLLRRLRAQLNKLTPQTYDEIFDSICSIGITNTEEAGSFVNLIFEKAITNHQYIALYARLCEDLRKTLSGVFTGQHGFKRLMVTCCQTAFDHNLAHDFVAPEDATEEEKFELLLEHKKKMKGNLLFVGALAHDGLLSGTVLIFIADELMKSERNLQLEAFAAFVPLLTSVLLCAARFKSRMLELIEKTRALSNDERFERRVRCLLSVRKRRLLIMLSQDAVETAEDHIKRYPMGKDSDNILSDSRTVSRS